MEYLVQILDEHATPTTFDKICYYLEKEFLDVIADEMQVWLGYGSSCYLHSGNPSICYNLSLNNNHSLLSN